MKRKISVALAFALLALLAAVTALAAGLRFSTRYDVKRAALDAIEAKYGITEEMLTVLHVEVGEPDENGAQTVTLTPVERQYAQRVGKYAATVQGGKVAVSWSHDGEEVGEGIESPIYGAEQVKALCENYTGVMQYLFEAEDGDGPEWDDPIGPVETPPAGEDLSEWLDAEMTREETEWAARKAAAEAEAKLSIDECRALAIDAIRDIYGLSDAQVDKLQTYDDRNGMLFETQDGHPVISVMYWLWQGDEESGHTEMDGIYWVDVNMDTGVIEDVLYDSAMAGNG